MVDNSTLHIRNIILEAIQLYFRNIFFLVGITIFAYSPSYLFDAALTENRYLVLMSSPTANYKIGWISFGFIIVFLLEIYASILVILKTRLTKNKRNIGLKNTLVLAFRKFPGYVLTLVIKFFFLGLAALVFVLPAIYLFFLGQRLLIILSLLLIVPFVVFFHYWIFVPFTVIFHNKIGMKALNHSREIVQEHLWQVLGFTATLFMITFIIMYVVVGPFYVVEKLFEDLSFIKFIVDFVRDLVAWLLAMVLYIFFTKIDILREEWKEKHKLNVESTL